jgi:hypothetical protein
MDMIDTFQVFNSYAYVVYYLLRYINKNKQKNCVTHAVISISHLKYHIIISRTVIFCHALVVEGR